MKKWILRHPKIGARVIAVASYVTAMYGLGHIASAFGVELDAIPAAKPFTHVFIGASLLVSGLTGRVVYLRLRRQIDRNSLGNRQSMARAIWQRAEQNYLEETRSRGR
jgi:hypothetical protein